MEEKLNQLKEKGLIENWDKFNWNNDICYGMTLKGGTWIREYNFKFKKLIREE